jgi:hypothetical protein
MSVVWHETFEIYQPLSIQNKILEYGKTPGSSESNGQAPSTGFMKRAALVEGLGLG